MKLKVHDIEGKAGRRSVTLDEAVFGVEAHEHAVWLDVRRTQAARRQGTHKTKERGEVAGSTRKLYRQKGTGNARAGSAKSPIRRSGGRTFGPRPRDYVLKVNKKTQRLARRSVLSEKARHDAIRIIEDFTFDEPSTRQMVSFLDAQQLSGTKVLLLTNGNQAEVNRSGANIHTIVVKEAIHASTEDLLRADTIVIQEGAVEALTTVLAP